MQYPIVDLGGMDSPDYYNEYKPTIHSLWIFIPFQQPIQLTWTCLTIIYWHDQIYLLTSLYETIGQSLKIYVSLQFHNKI